MKRNRIVAVTTVLLVSTFGLQPLALRAQGSLTPPGPPALSMKSLDQIEARTAISSAPFTITSPGSYYLTANLNVTSGDAIDINTNGVTLDLNGFTISSTANPAAGYGIQISDTLMNVTVRNGFILSGVTNTGGVYSGNGFLIGVGNSGVCYNLRVSDVSVSGCLQGGINLNRHSTVVEFCTVNTVGSEGIYAETVSDSTAFNCGGRGISAQIANNCYGASSGDKGLSAATANNCYGTSSSSSISTTTDGLSANVANNCYGYNSSLSGTGDGLSAATAINCYGLSFGGDGMDVVNANNCYGTSSGGNGVNAAYAAMNCYGTSSSGDGLYATTALNCWGQSNSSYGLYAFRTAIGCYGQSGSNIGLYVYTGVAFGCFGYNTTTGSSVPALKVYVANGCYGQNGSGTSEFTGNTGTDQRYNMP
jgi:hypothetical protein